MKKALAVLALALVVLISCQTQMGNVTLDGNGAKVAQSSDGDVQQPAAGKSDQQSGQTSEKTKAVGVFVYGDRLSKTQISETESLLSVPGDQEIERLSVTAEDLARYTKSAYVDWNMFSSAFIVKREKGSGNRVFINTPKNITEITQAEYLNAVNTAGIVDSDIIVGSPVAVTGQSALVGIFKAAERFQNLDLKATSAAMNEIVTLNEIATENRGKAGFSTDKFNEAIAQIKVEIGNLINNNGTITNEQTQNIITNVFNKFSIDLSELQLDRIKEWAKGLKDINIDWDVLIKSSGDILESIKKTAGELYEWGKNSGIVDRVIDGVKGFVDGFNGNKK